MIKDARIINSVIRRDMVVEDGAVVEESIIMDHTVVGKGCRLKRVIVDKFNVIAAGSSIGLDPKRDSREGRHHVGASGIVVVPKSQRPRGREARAQ